MGFKASPFKGKNLIFTVVFIGLLVAWILFTPGCDQQRLDNLHSCLTQEEAAAVALANAAMVKGTVMEIESATDSMGQTISEHAFIVLVDAWKVVAVNQAIVFVDRDGDFVVHRVVEVTEAGVRTAGDRNNYTDRGLVTRGNYVGTVIVQVYHQ
jgi:hypothetical protein